MPPLKPTDRAAGIVPPTQSVWVGVGWMLMVGSGLTTTDTFEVAPVQGAIPVVVKVNTAVPTNPNDGVHVEFNELALEKTPPAGVVQVPPVAEPPTVPDSVTVPSLQMVCVEPAVAVGEGVTVIVNVALNPEQITGPVIYLGVTVIVATTGDVPGFNAVNGRISPVPLDTKPIEVVLFAHV